MERQSHARLGDRGYCAGIRNFHLYRYGWQSWSRIQDSHLDLGGHQKRSYLIDLDHGRWRGRHRSGR
jgi:hypothetical protein